MERACLALMFALSTVHCLDPKVEITASEPLSFEDKTIQAERDRFVTLSCFVEDPPPNAQVRWQKHYTDSNGFPQVDQIATDMGIVDYTKYSVEKPTDYTWRLRIKNIQVFDEGKYVCFIQLTEIAQTNDWRHISVLVPPYFSLGLTSSDSTLFKGGAVDLTCDAQGRPEPTVEWRRIGGALLPIGKEMHMGKTLAIKDIQPEDRGVYRCRAWNSIGSIYRDIDVDVRFEPIISIPIAQKKTYQASGYRTELQCFVEANPLPSKEQMKWIKVDSGQSFSVTSDRYIIRTLEGAFNRLNYELIIDGVSDSDYGQWTCQIRNSMSLTGPSVGNLELIRSETPQNSIKLGQVIKGGEWRYGHASHVFVSMATLIMCLITAALHYL